ncbi:2-phosphosulfolactate phosphatase [Haloarchaeobius sp. TZWWS8]|uniref:2-phosphosulfolactate phosphatase n=1 Tax=Haloarchaeobius sp. TZWWS8 TaxID=3446121 RepID=UPI003EB6A25A
MTGRIADWDDFLTNRLVERLEDLPADPRPGNYVVVDVMHFSTTVVELLANGAEYVHITEERGDEFAFRESNPDAVIGGETMPGYEPADGFDFFNSPSYVQSLDLNDRPVAMTSSNGGRAVDALLDAPDTTVYVGSTTNAAALGRHLQDSDDQTYLVAAGKDGEPATEDTIGAMLVARHLAELPPAPIEAELWREQLEYAKGPNYPDKHEVRSKDVREFAMALSSREVVPRLDGRRIVDVAREPAS